MKWKQHLCTSVLYLVFYVQVVYLRFGELFGFSRELIERTSATFALIENDFYNSWTYPSSSSEGYQLRQTPPFTSRLPHSLSCPPPFPCVEVVRATFQPGFTLLGDGPVALALVVRWSACLAQIGWGIGGKRKRGCDEDRNRQWTELSSQKRKRVGQILAGILHSSLWWRATRSIYHCVGVWGQLLEETIYSGGRHFAGIFGNIFCNTHQHVYLLSSGWMGEF